MIDVVTIETPGLGDRSYLVTDGSVAIVVDPQRDIDRIQRIIDERALELQLVLETHIHNDYVSGGLDLARRSRAEYVVAGAEPVSFERRAIAGGDEIRAGSLHVRARHTPGHTPHHLAYVVSPSDDAPADALVFTGGSLLYGTVGRTDLVDPAKTEELTRAQYRSTRALLAELDARVRVLPTHGFGSFCSSAPADDESDGTIGGEREVNQAARIPDEETFVATITGGLNAFPSYYRHMAPLNRAGPPPVDLSPVLPAGRSQLQRALSSGGWAVDVRHRREFADGHIPGTVNIGLDGSFATYLGWVVPWGTPVTLLGETGELAEARRELVRIGIDEVDTAGAAPDLAAPELGSYPVVNFKDVAQRQETDAGQQPIVVVDVRRDDEWERSHVRNAVHIPLPDLQERAGELPDAQLWVHCASGFRASIAASLLKRAGHDVVLIDDDFEAADDVGLLAD